MQTITSPDVVADLPDVPIASPARPLVEGNPHAALLLAKASKVGRQ